jgi:5-methylcytosine-specific restriction endonuclease McrA
MPIPRELRKFYTAASGWPAIRRRILERAGHCCEQCGVPNGEVAARNGGWWAIPGLAYAMDANGQPACPVAVFLANRYVRIVLTIAHLNHNPADNRDENLKALCQWCHLNWDRLHHKETRCQRKDSARPLFAQV